MIQRLATTIVADLILLLFGLHGRDLMLKLEPIQLSGHHSSLLTVAVNYP